MAAAARIGDPTTHGGNVTGPGVTTVLIGGVPASVSGDAHKCGDPTHAANTVAAGSSTVLIGGRPAARVGDATACGASIVSGATNVVIGG